MTVHLKDLSKVYLQNVYESSHNSDDESKMKKSKHKKEEDKEDKEENGEEEGDEPRWQDSDGDGKWYEPGEDVAAPKKKKVTKEGFSNWRNDLIEVIEPERLPSKMKEGKVDNYSGKNKCVTLNPEIKEGVQIIESVELSEEYVDQIIEFASQYFYEQGYNSKDIEVISEGMGHNEFVDFVFDIGNTFFLNEAAFQGELLTSKGRARKNPKVSAAKGASTPVSHTPSSKKEGKPEEKKSSPGQLSIDYNKKSTPSGQEKLKTTVGSLVRSATSPKTKKTVGSAVKGAANTAARVALAGWQGHKAAMKKKQEGGTVAQQIGAGAGRALGSFFRKGKEHLKNSYEFQIDEKNQGPSTPVKQYDGKFMPNLGAGRVKNVRLKSKHTVNSEGFILDEKAESEQQQKLFGLALSVKRGETPRSEVSAEVLKIVDSMSEKEIRKFAKTKHEGIPKKVKEDLQPTTRPQLAALQKLTKAQREVTIADQQALRKQKPEVEKPTQTEQVKKPSALDIVRQQVIAKHGAASLMGTPENEAARKAAAAKTKPQPKPSPKKRYEDDVYSKDGLGGIRGYRAGD